MPITGVVEESGQFGIRGWLSRETPAQFVPSVDVVVNRRLAAVVSGIQTGPARYRFSFNPFESLQPGSNTVEIFVTGSDQLIENGAFSIELEPVTRPNAEVSLPGPSSDGQIALGPGICEHCFPSVAVVLTRIYRQLKPGGIAVLDFLSVEPELKSSYATVAAGGKFTRIYSEPELRSFVLDVGFEILEIRQTTQNRVELQAKKPEVSR